MRMDDDVYIEGRIRDINIEVDFPYTTAEVRLSLLLTEESKSALNNVFRGMEGLPSVYLCFRKEAPSGKLGKQSSVDDVARLALSALLGGVRRKVTPKK